MASAATRTQELVGQARRWAGSVAGRSRWLTVAVEVWSRDRRVGGTLLAAALAFRIFIWLLPCTLLICALIGFSSSGEGSVGSISRRVGLSPLTAGLLEQVANQARGGRVVTAALALVFLAVAGAGLARAMDGVRVRVWGPFERRGIGAVLVRAAAYSGVLLAVIVSNAGVGLLRAATGLPGVLLSLVAVAVFVVVGVLMLASGVSDWRAALPGAVVFALGLELLRLVSMHYLPARFERATQLYGALGVSAAVLIWLTLIARLIVFGHVLNAVLWQHTADRDRHAGEVLAGSGSARPSPMASGARRPPAQANDRSTGRALD